MTLFKSRELSWFFLSRKKKISVIRQKIAKAILHIRNGVSFCSHSCELPYYHLSSILPTKKYVKKRRKGKNSSLCIINEVDSKNQRYNTSNFSWFYMAVFINFFSKDILSNNALSTNSQLFVCNMQIQKILKQF